MCYYDSFVWGCRDWKWGNFRQHCHKEYRLGETCGTKLVFFTHYLEESCKLCLRIEAKQRRIAKHAQDIARWNREPNKFKASMERAWSEIRLIQAEILALQLEKAEKYQMVGNPRRC